MARRRSRDNKEQRPHRCIWPLLPPAPAAAPPPPPPAVVTTTVVACCEEFFDRLSVRTVAFNARLATFALSAVHFHYGKRLLLLPLLCLLARSTNDREDALLLLLLRWLLFILLFLSGSARAAVELAQLK